MGLKQFDTWGGGGGVNRIQRKNKTVETTGMHM